MTGFEIALHLFAGLGALVAAFVVIIIIVDLFDRSTTKPSEMQTLVEQHADCKVRIETIYGDTIESDTFTKSWIGQFCSKESVRAGTVEDVLVDGWLEIPKDGRTFRIRKAEVLSYDVEIEDGTRA